MNLFEKLFSIFPQELILKSGGFFVTRIIGGFLAFFFAWWVSQLGGASMWGMFSIYITTLNILMIICLLGIDTILVKYIAEFNHKDNSDAKSSYYWSGLILSSGCALFLSGILQGLSRYGYLPVEAFGMTDELFIILIWTMPAYVIFALNRNVYRGLKRMISFGVLKNVLVYGSLFLIAFIVSVNNSFQITLSILLWIHFVIINVLAFLTILDLIVSGKIKIKGIQLTSFKKLLKESLPLLLFASMTLVVNYVDIFMLGYFKTTKEVGVYDIAIKFSSNMSIFLLAVHAYLMPRFAEVFGKGDMKLLAITLKQSTKLIFWTSIPLFLVGLFFARFLMLLYGVEFLDGVFALQVLIVAQIIGAVCGAVAVFLQMTNNQTLFQNIFLVATGINVILNYLLIPRYGINGAAFASLICTLFWNVCSVYFINRRLGMMSIYIPFVKK